MWPRIFPQLSFIFIAISVQHHHVSGFKVILPKDCGRAGPSSEPTQAGAGQMDSRLVPSFVVIAFVSNETISPCAGTVLTNRLVLTSAKCLNRFHFARVNILVLQTSSGTIKSQFDLMSQTILNTQMMVCSSRRHRDMFSHASHDIAIIQLASPLTFSDTTQAACLPDEKADHWPKEELYAVGVNEFDAGDLLEFLKEPERIPFPITFDVEVSLTRLPLESASCSNENYHLSIACLNVKSGEQTSEELVDMPICGCHQGAPIMGGLGAGGRHTLLGVISQPWNADCSRAPSSIQAADLLFLRREILELAEDCSFGLD